PRRHQGRATRRRRATVASPASAGAFQYCAEGQVRCALSADSMDRRDGRGLRVGAGVHPGARGARAATVHARRCRDPRVCRAARHQPLRRPCAVAIQDNLLATVLSFINCEKYPPSLLYLGMTLGPALMLVAAFERVHGPVADWIATFGRVPFFYYVVHIFLLHALAIVFAWATIGDIGFLFGPLAGRKPATYGLDLAGIYAVWLAVVVALYPLCRWFARIQCRRP